MKVYILSALCLLALSAPTRTVADLFTETISLDPPHGAVALQFLSCNTQVTFQWFSVNIGIELLPSANCPDVFTPTTNADGSSSTLVPYNASAPLGGSFVYNFAQRGTYYFGASPDQSSCESTQVRQFEVVGPCVQELNQDGQPGPVIMSMACGDYVEFTSQDVAKNNTIFYLLPNGTCPDALGDEYQGIIQLYDSPAFYNIPSFPPHPLGAYMFTKPGTYYFVSDEMPSNCTAGLPIETNIFQVSGSCPDWVNGTGPIPTSQDPSTTTGTGSSGSSGVGIANPIATPVAAGPAADTTPGASTSPVSGDSSPTSGTSSPGSTDGSGASLGSDGTTGYSSSGVTNTATGYTSTGTASYQSGVLPSIADMTAQAPGTGVLAPAPAPAPGTAQAPAPVPSATPSSRAGSLSATSGAPAAFASAAASLIGCAAVMVFLS